MKTVFFIAAAVMVAVALTVLLLPLLREGRKSGRPRSVFFTAIGIALALPLLTGMLYLKLGMPVAINGVEHAAEPALSMDQALTELREHLKQQPDDEGAWMLLAQTSTMLGKPADAREAYDHVLKLAPNNAEAMVGWAESDSMARDDHLFQGRAQELLKRAVALHPDSQRGLWLLGISYFQQGDYSGAAATWRVLQPQLAPGSKVAKSVAEQIAIADARAGGAPATASSVHAAAATGVTLQVHVTLAPALKDKLAQGDTLFVYARAPDGPPMPLAVARLDASSLPTTVSLTDAMAMAPEFKLSSVDHVFVGARISHHGQAVAESGDLEGDAGVVPVNSRTPIAVTIDKVH